MSELVLDFIDIVSFDFSISIFILFRNCKEALLIFSENTLCIGGSLSLCLG